MEVWVVVEDDRGGGSCVASVFLNKESANKFLKEELCGRGFVRSCQANDYIGV